jgi:hypothetical protein
VDAIFVADVIYVLVTSACIGFVLYGGWLCIDQRERAAQKQDRAETALPGLKEPSL